MAKQRRTRSARTQKSRFTRTQYYQPQNVVRSFLSPLQGTAPRALRFEPLEMRHLLTVGPHLVAIIPNQGEVIEDDGTRYTAPQELTFRFDEDQVIAADSLDGIQIERSGLDGVLDNENDISITPGFIGIGEQPNEVIVRFAEGLPDDLYRITIVGAGPGALRNTDGEAFNCEVDVTLQFDLDLGAQIIAVVTQPTDRSGSDVLTQSRNTIEVYFNDDPLNVAAAQNVAAYQLISTNQTADLGDDVVFAPTSVAYDATANKAVLTFADDLANLDPAGGGTLRLRIGNEYQPTQTATIVSAEDAGSSFDTASEELGSFGVGSMSQSVVVTGGSIEPTQYEVDYLLEWPGGVDEPGHRQLVDTSPLSAEDHFVYNSTLPDVIFQDPVQPASEFFPPSPADQRADLTTIQYNFQDAYGFDPVGNVLNNVITEVQKTRSREIFDLLSHYIGVQFEETIEDGITVATGDIRAIFPTHQPNVAESLLGAAQVPLFPGTGGLVVISAANNWGTSPFGGEWFVTAMHQILHTLGLGHTYDLPGLTIMGSSVDADFHVGTSEGLFPGDHDIVHGRHMYQPSSNDIDLHMVTLETAGLFSAETIAERNEDFSHLDSVLTLYREFETDNNAGQLITEHEVISRNDDYNSEDSFIELFLEAGTYYIGVTSTGNANYDPDIEDSGGGGTSQGAYDLRVNFVPEVTDQIVDETDTLFDGDADGSPGGQYNFWFNAKSLQNTFFVDKANDSPASSQDGSLENPHNTISAAFAAAQSGDLVRIVGNNFDNDDLSNPSTLQDNQAYEIGFDVFGSALSDGSKMEIPQNVTVAIDGGAVFKLREAIIDVGSSAQEIDRSLGSLQVLGTPDNQVFFTSFHNEDIGTDGEPFRNTDPERGEWGGLVFQNDQDYEAGRTVLESEGIFLNYVNHANISFGGGTVSVNSIRDSFTPIHMIVSRPTVSFNSIVASAHGAMSADPNSFEESTFGSHGLTATATLADEFDPDNDGTGLVGMVGVTSADGGIAVATITPAGDNNDLTITANNPGLQFENVAIIALADPGTGDQAVVAVDFGAGILTIRIDPLATTAATVLAAINDEGTYAAVLDVTQDPTNDGSGLVSPFGIIGTTLGGAATFVLPGDNNDFEFTDLPGTDVNIVLVDDRAFGDQAIITLDADESTLTIDIEPLATSAQTVVDAINALGNFTADYQRIGPDIHGNIVVDNTFNGIFVRVSTAAGGTLDELEVNARLDDTDIVHLISENLIISGNPGGPLTVPDPLNPDATILQQRPDARLRVDPGVITKLDGARIEAEIGTQFIAEGSLGQQVIFTSLLDSRFGAGGTFVTTEDLVGNGPAPGDWGGLYFGPTSTASIDHALIAHGGGTTTIEGDFARFNPIEIHQARVRITNSVIDDNADGGAGDRNGRQPTVSSTIFIRGAQPVIVNNTFRDNLGPVISVNPNSMNSELNPDWGRSTGELIETSAFKNNVGPLIRQNSIGNNGLNGLEVRGETLTTETVWDDTDIVHILRDEIIVPNHHSFSGLRLQSSETESLVVKLFGSTAGFTATGSPGDIDDRIGGTVHIIGTPGHPVIFTSVSDDTFGAGLDPMGQPQNDTTNDGPSEPAPGDWRSIKLDRYSNDRNVGIVNESEHSFGTTADFNGIPLNAQFIGDLAPSEKGGDENLLLGYQINGVIRFDDPGDSDVYSFRAEAGTEVWLEIDRSSQALDSIVELLDADGSVLAGSDNSFDEQNGLIETTGLALTMDRDVWLTKDIGTTNPRDAGMRISLPGPAGEVRTYFVRVRSALAVSNLDVTQLSDKVSFNISDGSPKVIFELDSGPEVRFDPAATVQSVRDGQTFTSSDGVDSRTFEFNSGPVLVVGDGSLLVIGDTVVIRDTSGQNSPVVFEFVDTGGAVAPGNVAIEFAGTESVDDVIGLIVDAINGAELLNDTAAGYSPDGTEGRITLEHGQTISNILTALAPAGDNNDILISAVTANATLENVDVVFVNDTATGNEAFVTFDDVAGTLTIDVDPTATTAATVVEVINTEGTFAADLDTRAETTNDGSGLIADTGSLGITAGTTGVSIEEDGELTNPTNVEIAFRETDSELDFLSKIANTVSFALPTIMAGAGTVSETDLFGVPIDILRLTLHGATSVDLSGVPALTRVNNTETGVNASHVDVPFTAADSPADLAEAIASAIVKARTTHGLLIVPRVKGDTLVFDSPHAKPDMEDSPFVIEGPTKGVYQLHLRLREIQEYAGSTVRYASIHYATNGIELLGLPTHSPLLAELSEVDFEDEEGINNDTFAVAQNIGNLLDSDRGSLLLTGALSEAGDIDWYQFTLEAEKLFPPLILRGDVLPQDTGIDPEFANITEISTWPVTFDIDYTDGVERPDTSIWVFNSGGELIYTGQDSSVVDDRPGPLEGADLENVERGTIGALDPLVGSINLVEGETYFVAITGQDQVPTVLSTPLLRQEPIVSLFRIAEDHIEGQDLSFIGGRPLTNMVDEWPYSTILNPTPDEFHLGDVVTYISTGNELLTINPFTGLMVTDVTGDGSLPGTDGDVIYYFGDIGMRNDGQLYTFTSSTQLAGRDKNADAGIYARLSTGDGTFLSQQDDGIVTFLVVGEGEEAMIEELGNNDPLEEPGGVNFDAMVHEPGPALVNRRVLAVGTLGNTPPDGDPVDAGVFLENLLYLFNPDGTATEHDSLVMANDGRDRIPTNIIPLGQLFPGIAIVGIDATQTSLESPSTDILDGTTFTVVDENDVAITYEFDTGVDVDLDEFGAPPVRDGEAFMLDDGSGPVLFEFDSGPVITVGDILTLIDGQTFTVQDDTTGAPDANEPITFELDDAAAGDGVGDGNTPITFDSAVGGPAENAVQLIQDAINAQSTAGMFNVVATGVTLSETEGRISLEFDDTVVGIRLGEGTTSIQLEGNYGLNDAAHVPIPFEEGMPETSVFDAETGDPLQVGFGERIVEVVEGALAGIDASFAHRADALMLGDRINFFMAMDSGFAPTFASATITLIGANNDFTITANASGTNLNNVDVVFEDSGTPGDTATAIFDNRFRTLTIGIDPGATTAATVLAAIDAEGTFTAAADTTVDSPNNLNGLIDALGPQGTTGGGLGVASFTVRAGLVEAISAQGIAETSNIQVPLLAENTAQDIADIIAFAVNNTAGDFPEFVGVSNVVGSRANLTFVDPDQLEVDLPLETFGSGGPGGRITGMTFVGTDLYAVSNRGGLYTVENAFAAGFQPSPPIDAEEDPADPPDSVAAIPGGPELTLIASLNDGTEQIVFSGLATGPQNVEDGRYAATLFATDADGILYAFDTEGAFQPIFLDGHASVDTTLAGATGIDFSPIDYNLWHATGYRGSDPGHGVNIAPDGSRLEPIEGGLSFYFGFEDPEAESTENPQPGAENFSETNPDVFYSYDLPGGAHGSLTTDPFSLLGYDPADKPTLYFNYFLDNGDVSNLDTAKVFISGDGGAVWTQLGGNLADSSDSWNQARLDISAFAGMENIKLRFDFYTAGELHVGDEFGATPDSEFLTGAYLRAMPGSELNDGELFVVDAELVEDAFEGGQAFEFELGFELLMPNLAGASIQDDPILGGESFTIVDQSGETLNFEFDNDGILVGGDVGIPIYETNTSNEVAVAIQTAIENSDLSDVMVYVNGAKVTLQGTADVTQSLGAAITLQGGNGVALTSVPIPITPDMTAEQVAEEITNAVDQFYSGLRQFRTVDGNTLLSGFQPFFGELDDTVDVANDGTGLIGESAPSATISATEAGVTITPTGLNNDIRITTTTVLDNVEIVFTNNSAVGNTAIVTLQSLAPMALTIDVDPDFTTADTVVDAINAEGSFTAVLDVTNEPTNDGSGLITDTGLLATTVVTDLSAMISLAGQNNDFRVFAPSPVDPQLIGVQIVFINEEVEDDQATVSFDAVTATLTIDYDPMATTTNTVLGAIIASSMTVQTPQQPVPPGPPMPVFFTPDPVSGNPFDGWQISWVDFDNDGWTDAVAGGLWRNNEGALEAFPSSISGVGTWGDYDNDGFPDFFATSRQLWHNDNGVGFTDVSEILPELPPEVDVTLAAAFGDVNDDGFLDLYIGGYESWPTDYWSDALLINNAGESFDLVYTQNPPQPARGITTFDFDEDFDLDIYTSNYRLEPNLLWQNDGQGNLTDVAAELGATGGSGHTIGSAVGDIDNDGHLDLFVGNFSHAGQPAAMFLRNTGPEGGYAFELMNELDGPDYQESYASPALADIDNDGDLDLYFTTVYAGDNARVYENVGDWNFIDVTAAVGLAGQIPTYQAGWADYDHDGDLDLMTAGTLYRNDVAGNNWLKVRLFGDGQNVSTTPVGTIVRADVNGQIITRQIEGATGQGNGNDLMTLHFGLGNFSGPVPLEITWTDGTVETANVAANQTSTVLYGNPAGSVSISDGGVTYIFQFEVETPDGGFNLGRIPIDPSMTPEQVAEIIVATFNTQNSAVAMIGLAGNNNDLVIRAGMPGLDFEDLSVVFMSDTATGDQAIVMFDPDAGTLTVDYDPTATTANTVLMEINTEGTFFASLDTTVDVANNGNGLIRPEGIVATTLEVATATVDPTDVNNDFTIRAVTSGSEFDSVDVVIENNLALGDVATVSLDILAGILTIDVDPTATTANTVLEEINAEGNFTAVLDILVDPTNDGTGLITDVGTLATTALLITSADVTLAGDNNDFTIDSMDVALLGTDVVFVSTLAVDDQAIVTFDSVAGTLTIDYDPTATTAYTVATEINAEGTFTASLNTTQDLTNDGSGLIAPTGEVATTSIPDFINIVVSADGDLVTLDGPVVLLSLGTSGLIPVGSVDSPDVLTSTKLDGSLLHIIGHSVTDAGPLFYSNVLGPRPFGDSDHPEWIPPLFDFDRFTNAIRGQDNDHEGFFIDNLIIGFAERGEMITGQSSDTSFTASNPGAAILTGDYQLEIRRGTEFGNPLYRGFDTNDRLNQQITLLAPAGGDIYMGQTFTVSDGIETTTFEYADEMIGESGKGVPIFFTGEETAGEIADLIAEAINGVSGLDISAASIPTSERIDLVGAANAEGISFIIFGDVANLDAIGQTLVFPQGPVEVTDIAVDGNSLRDEILGEGITAVGDAVLIGGSTSAGFWSDGLNSGIILSTGDVNFAAGPNTDDESTSTASGLPDADLDLEFGVETMDTTSLEFDFQSPGGNLFLEFVFASDEYNEFTNSEFNDVFAFFLDGENIALIPGADAAVAINNINSGFPLGEEATNPELHNNNDPGDEGEFLELIGYDGFTDVFVAEATELDPGVHTIKLVVSDVSDTLVDSAIFINSSSFSDQLPPQEFPPFEVTVISSGRTDTNNLRDQGQTIIHANTIFNSAEFGIRFDAGARDTWPHPGSVALLREVNTQRLIPGIAIENNLIAFGGEGGILFSGENDEIPEDMPIAAVPFGRIVNNTIFGAIGSGIGVGVQVTENASPTILNNILAGLDTGVEIDASSTTTVIGANVYQNNLTNTIGEIPGGAFEATEISLDPSDPLFVNPADGNFQLAADSQAIDSSINALPDRPEMTTVRAPLGILPSPILAPELDLIGQLRADDPSVAPPPGLGLNVFKDRGALERDQAGPTANLVLPLDNDAEGVDLEPNPHEVWLVGESLSEFSIQLSDKGIGIDDNAVTSETIAVLRDDILLTVGLDYLFSYDPTNDVIYLIAGPGIWSEGRYTIQLDNSTDDGNEVDPIQDLADNPLSPNQPDGTSRFIIQIGGATDFGDAPIPYPTSLPDGASHGIADGFFLGLGVDAESNGDPSPGANADSLDDGVDFDTILKPGVNAQITVEASTPGVLNAWIDFNTNNVWEASERIFGDQSLVSSVPNVLTFSVPNTATAGDTYARFRFNSAGGLGPNGPAEDGEVEDYLVQIVPPVWQNQDDNIDVNGDGVLSSQDVFILSYFLYYFGQQPVPDGPPPYSEPFPTNGPPPLYDVNGDDFVGFQDAFIVALALRNQFSNLSTATATEGDQAVAPAVLAAVALDNQDLAPNEAIISSSSEERVVTTASAITVPGAETAIPSEIVAAVDGNLVSESTAELSSTNMMAAFFIEDAASPSLEPAYPTGSDDRDLVAVAFANSGERNVTSDNRTVAVERVVATSLWDDDSDSVDSRSPIATSNRESDTLDEFFAQFKDIEQFE